MAKSAKWLFENWACASSPSGFRGREKERERERESERASERASEGGGERGRERERESAMVLASIQHRFNGH